MSKGPNKVSGSGVSICVYVCKYVSVYMYICEMICIYDYKRIDVYMYVYLYIYVDILLQAVILSTEFFNIEVLQSGVCSHVCMYLYLYICIYVYLLVYMYRHFTAGHYFVC